MRSDFGAGTPSSRSQLALGRAGSISWRLTGLEVALSNAVWLRLFLNLVNNHAACLIVRKRLRVIAVARMHPHT